MLLSDMGSGPTPTLIALGRLIRRSRDGAGLLQTEPANTLPGLLQTEDYARALLAEGESAVVARMERQAILQGDNPPMLRCVLDEAVLLRERGGPCRGRRRH